MKKIILSFLAGMGLLSGCHAGSGVEKMSPNEFAEAVRDDSLAVVIDVRRESEYAEGHLQGALLIDFLDEQTFDEEIAKLDKEKHYYIYCRSGRRSHSAALKMQKLGLTVVDMAGGFLAWSEAGLPLDVAE